MRVTVERRSVKVSVGVVLVSFLCAGAIDAEQYTVFSLNVAQRRIQETGEAWREKELEIFTLAGINKVEGFVYDTEACDLILVGQHEDTRAILTLDDLVVALRARFHLNEWPLVSIDPTPDAEKPQMQHVRFEGGIQNTAFGHALLEADYCLKRLAVALEIPGIPSFRTYWDRIVEESERSTVPWKRRVSSRFWFYPINPHVVVREGVCIVRGLNVGVFTEVLSAEIDGKAVANLREFKDQSCEAFAKDVSDRFEELCQVHDSFRRLPGLQELVALSKALEDLVEKPDFAWWLGHYRLQKTETPKEMPMLWRRYDGQKDCFEMSGGVRMTALALRLKAGDVRALREAVLMSRPGPEALCWQLVIDEWGIGTISGALKLEEEIQGLYAQALFLHEQERYKDAINLYEQINGMAPVHVAVLCDMGAALGGLGRHGEAIKCFDLAIEIDPNIAIVWHNKSISLGKLGHPQEALECAQRAVEINPAYALAWAGCGSALITLGHYEKALESYDRALSLYNHDALAWVGKGLAFLHLGRHEEALSSLAQSLELDPSCANSWDIKGTTLGKLGRHDEALKCFDRAVGFNPSDPAAWFNKSLTLIKLGRHEEALTCCQRALEIKPDYAEALSLRFDALQRLERHTEALACLNRLLEMQPTDDVLWSNKGVALAKLGRLPESLDAFDQALRLNPQSANAWLSKGISLAKLGRRQEAIECYSCALEFDSSIVEAWYGKGFELQQLGRHGEALKCLAEAVKLDPRNARTWRSKGLALGELNRHQEAFDCFRQAVELDPADWKSWGNMGFALENLGHYEQALAYFERVLQINPNDSVARSKRDELTTKSRRK